MTDSIIIIDNGSKITKCGFNTATQPTHIFPSIVGNLRFPNYPSMIGNDIIQDFYVGNDVKSVRSILRLQWPINNGIIRNFDEMEKIWDYIFHNQLKLNNSSLNNCNVLLTDNVFNTLKNKQKIMEIMFEKYNINSLYIQNQSVLSLYASNKSNYNGIVINLGGGISQIVPIWHGHPIKSGIKTLRIDSDELLYFFTKLLQEKGYSWGNSGETEILKDMKNKLCYVAQDYDKELNQKDDCLKQYELPDGQIVSADIQRFKCLEAYFKPNMLRLTMNDGIHQLCFQSIMKCNSIMRKDMFSNIILCGGNSIFPGFKQRLEMEMYKLVFMNSIDHIDNVNVIAPKIKQNNVGQMAHWGAKLPERHYLAWKGGSILSSSSLMEKLWITKSEYNDFHMNMDMPSKSIKLFDKSILRFLVAVYINSLTFSNLIPNDIVEYITFFYCS